MADQIEKLRESIDNLTASLKGGAAGGSSTPNLVSAFNARDKEETEKKKAATGFSGISSGMKSFGLSLLSVGTVLRGLQNTREGYQLDYSIKHIFYEISDMLRGPIRAITNELEGFAQVMHYANAEASSGGGKGIFLRAQINRATLGAFGDNPLETKEALKRLAKGEKAMASEHLAPIFKSSFGDVAGLQQRMQALSTENPAQQRGLSLLEQLYNTLVKIYNKLPGEGQMAEIPNPLVKKD